MPWTLLQYRPGRMRRMGSWISSDGSRKRRLVPVLDRCCYFRSNSKLPVRGILNLEERRDNSNFFKENWNRRYFFWKNRKNVLRKSYNLFNLDSSSIIYLLYAIDLEYFLNCFDYAPQVIIPRVFRLTILTRWTPHTHRWTIFNLCKKHKKRLEFLRLEHIHAMENQIYTKGLV